MAKEMKIHENKIPTPKTKKTTKIIFLLDDSGSMGHMKEEAVSGYNEFLETQQKVKGKATISLYFFNGALRPIYENVDVKKAKPINVGTHMSRDELSYVPSGMTSLYDSIHRVISEYKSGAPKGEKTIFAILTDGEDTSSQKHTYHTVQPAIKEAQEGLEWEILFLGANMNAHHFARNVGIKASNVAQFDYTKKGVSDAIRTAAFAASYSRGDVGTLSKAAAAGISGQSLNMTNVYVSMASGAIDNDDAGKDPAKD